MEVVKGKFGERVYFGFQPATTQDWMKLVRKYYGPEPRSYFDHYWISGDRCLFHWFSCPCRRRLVPS